MSYNRDDNRNALASAVMDADALISKLKGSTYESAAEELGDAIEGRKALITIGACVFACLANKDKLLLDGKESAVAILD